LQKSAHFLTKIAKIAKTGVYRDFSLAGVTVFSEKIFSGIEIKRETRFSKNL